MLGIKKLIACFAAHARQPAFRLKLLRQYLVDGYRYRKAAPMLGATGARLDQPSAEARAGSRRRSIRASNERPSEQLSIRDVIDRSGYILELDHAVQLLGGQGLQGTTADHSKPRGVPDGQALDEDALTRCRRVQDLAWVGGEGLGTRFPARPGEWKEDRAA